MVAILPTQNPDGRELDTRRNAYGFDMNRDWFARTQPETDGKLEALRAATRRCCSSTTTRWARKTFFFPPNADPIYHEITDESASTGSTTSTARAMQAEFDRQGIPYFNYDVYDMFYMGYGDTVPTTGFLGAGMTFEKDSYALDQDPGLRAVRRAVDVAVRRRGRASVACSSRWAALVPRGATRQGQAGLLEPNEVVQPGNDGAEPGARPARSGTTSCAPTTRPRPRGAAPWSAGCSGWTSRCGG